MLRKSQEGIYMHRVLRYQMEQIGRASCRERVQTCALPMLLSPSTSHIAPPLPGVNSFNAAKISGGNIYAPCVAISDGASSGVGFSIIAFILYMFFSTNSKSAIPYRFKSFLFSIFTPEITIPPYFS